MSRYRGFFLIQRFVSSIENELVNQNWNPKTNLSLFKLLVRNLAAELSTSTSELLYYICCTKVDTLGRNQKRTQPDIDMVGKCRVRNYTRFNSCRNGLSHTQDPVGGNGGSSTMKSVRYQLG